MDVEFSNTTSRKKLNTHFMFNKVFLCLTVLEITEQIGRYVYISTITMFSQSHSKLLLSGVSLFMPLFPFISMDNQKYTVDSELKRHRQKCSNPHPIFVFIRLLPDVYRNKTEPTVLSFCGGSGILGLVCSFFFPPSFLNQEVQYPISEQF
jgi:hypothetical protein